MKTYTEKEVVMAINVTAMIAHQIGDVSSITRFLQENVPEELHSKIIAANIGCTIFEDMFAVFNESLNRMFEESSSSEEMPKVRKKPKDISEMTSNELNEYIDQKLKEKREGK